MEIYQTHPPELALRHMICSVRYCVGIPYLVKAKFPLDPHLSVIGIVDETGVGTLLPFCRTHLETLGLDKSTERYQILSIEPVNDK